MSMCSKCGAEMADNVKYCKACGRSLSEGNATLSNKKARVMTRKRQWVKPAAIAAVAVLVVAAFWLARGVYLPKRMGPHPMFPPHRDALARLMDATSVRAQDGNVSVPLKTVEDGKAHFFAYPMGEKTITFFVMKAMDGSVRTAFDACMACNHAKLGYRQEGSLVVCNNCGMGFKPEEIGMVSRGCNPIPLNKSIAGQMIVLRAKDLEAGAQYF